MTFFAEYSAIGCGKEKESTQQSAVSIQPRRFTAKDAKSAKEVKGNFVSSMIRALTTLTTAGLSDLRALCGSVSLAEC
jgi:hypothetical protein